MRVSIERASRDGNSDIEWMRELVRSDQAVRDMIRVARTRAKDASPDEPGVDAEHLEEFLRTTE